MRVLSEKIRTMSEDDSSAVLVLVKLANFNDDDDETLKIIDGLEDMDVKGNDIWKVYQDAAFEDIRKFKELVVSRSVEVIKAMNYPTAKYGT